MAVIKLSPLEVGPWSGTTGEPLTIPVASALGLAKPVYLWLEAWRR